MPRKESQKKLKEMYANLNNWAVTVNNRGRIAGTHQIKNQKHVGMHGKRTNVTN